MFTTVPRARWTALTIGPSRSSEALKPVQKTRQKPSAIDTQHGLFHPTGAKRGARSIMRCYSPVFRRGRKWWILRPPQVMTTRGIVTPAPMRQYLG